MHLVPILLVCNLLLPEWDDCSICLQLFCDHLIFASLNLLLQNFSYIYCFLKKKKSGPKGLVVCCLFYGEYLFFPIAKSTSLISINEASNSSPIYPARQVNFKHLTTISYYYGYLLIAFSLGCSNDKSSALYEFKFIYVHIFSFFTKKICQPKNAPPEVDPNISREDGKKKGDPKSNKKNSNTSLYDLHASPTLILHHKFSL